MGSRCWHRSTRPSPTGQSSPPRSSTSSTPQRTASPFPRTRKAYLHRQRRNTKRSIRRRKKGNRTAQDTKKYNLKELFNEKTATGRRSYVMITARKGEERMASPLKVSFVTAAGEHCSESTRDPD